MTTPDALDLFEMGREEGREDAALNPLTEEQKRNIRALLRTADEADTRKAS